MNNNHDYLLELSERLKEAEKKYVAAELEYKEHLDIIRQEEAKIYLSFDKYSKRVTIKEREASIASTPKIKRLHEEKLELYNRMQAARIERDHLQRLFQVAIKGDEQP